MSRRQSSRRSTAALLAAAGCIFGTTLLIALPASALPVHQERYCESANAAIQAYYEQLNIRGTKDLGAIALKSEAAARALVSCARKGVAGSTIENDRLYIRAADALFIAAEARRRLGQNDARGEDLQAIVHVVQRIDSIARTSSNEPLYREARLLLRFTRHFIARTRA